MKHPTEPNFINKTDAFTAFHLIPGAQNKSLKNNRDAGGVKDKLSHLANPYMSSYKPWKKVLPRYRILNKLRNNKDILIKRPDKGNGVVIVD